MRLIAISILILAGAIMAAAGTLAESLPADPGRYNDNDMDQCGLLIVALGGVMLLAELYIRSPSSSSPSESRSETGVDA